MNMLSLAARNVFRNRRRSILNAIAIGLGVAIMIVALGWVQGYSTYIYSAIIRFQTGAAQLLRTGYEEVAARFPLDLTLPNIRPRGNGFSNAGSLGRQRSNRFSREGHHPERIHATSRTGNRRPGRERRHHLVQKNPAGSYLDGSPGLLLGPTIAKKLKLEPGASVIISATDRYGVENRIELPLRGIFSFGFGAMDDGIAFIDLASAQDLLDLGDEVTRIVLAGPRMDEVKKAASSFVLKDNTLPPTAGRNSPKRRFPGSARIQTVSISWR